MKKLLSLAVAALLALSAIAGALAETSDPLLSAAQAHVPENAVLLAQEMDDGLQVFKFWNDSTQEMYEVAVFPQTAKVCSLSSEAWNRQGSFTVALSREDVQALALEAYPDATVTFAYLDSDDGLYTYKVLFTTPNFAGKLEYNPETGALMERELDYTYQPGSASTAETEAAQALVLNRLENGVILSFKEDWDDGRLTFEGTASDGEYLYEFEVDASTGRFIEWEREAPAHTAQTSNRPQPNPSTGNDGLIGTARAKEIVLAKAGGGRVASIKLDRDDGRQIYEGKVYTDSYAYEFEIDAITGAILEWDADHLEHHDDDHDGWDDDHHGDHDWDDDDDWDD